MNARLPRGAAAAFAALALSADASAQWFVDNTSDVPQSAPDNASRSSDVDFADVDLDGDWDAAFADGGDTDHDQNRLWLNLGPTSLGVFEDETATRFPAINDHSRDIEFVDFDGDGDPDIYVSNTSHVANQSNRWWRNTGVGSGAFVDESDTRWVGLGQAGSSIAPNQVLPSGYIDFSCDCDFGDLDNDGDLDLVHSSYGGIDGGEIPTRIFLNDGVGFFSEFNPSGYQLPGQQIEDGMPGLWCEGVQEHDTTDVMGAACDIATTTLDVDVGDIDGDFDLDLLHGARSEPPRMFKNMMEENDGSLGDGNLAFIDWTRAAYPAGYSSGQGHYEQEMGDLDDDGDLDVYGLNWKVVGFTWTDVTLRNTGDGTYDMLTDLPESEQDDNQVDFIDYDNDGDLDLFVAGFIGQDRLYRNDLPGAGQDFSFTNVTSSALPSLVNFTSSDADVCDVDGDGDYDVFTANEFNGRNLYLQNTLDVADTHAPRLPKLEQAPDRSSGALPTVVRVHVYDNAPYYVTYFNPTVLEYTVDGGPPAQVPMSSSGGQVFRGELPGSLVGQVCYKAISADEYGNPGESATSCYTARDGGTLVTSSCFGDGGGTPCPCGNEAAPGSGRGCLNSSAAGAVLTFTGLPSIANDTLVLRAEDVLPGQPGLFFQGKSALNGGAGFPFGDGLRCCGVDVVRLVTIQPDAAGCAATDESCGVSVGQFPGPISQNPGNSGLTVGDTRCYQLWYRDPAGGPAPNGCGNSFNLTNALEVTWQP